jgi:hypothetical protein
VNTEEFDIQTIQSALQQLLQISTPQEGINVLLQHPELLTDQADLLLSNLVEQARGQGRGTFVRVLSGLRELVQEVRQTQATRN